MARRFISLIDAMSKIKEYLRPIRNQVGLRFAQFRVSWPTNASRNVTAEMCYVVGCGRSGTTILGKVLSMHPQIAYFFEPWHLWRVIDSRTDAIQLYGPADTRLLMGAEMCTREARRRFRRLFLEAAPSGKTLCVEKTPYNALRIDYLEALSPGAKYVHIVRDGIDVASSIAWLAETNPYKLAFRKDFNTWWGEFDAKWHALERNGADAGYFPRELPLVEAQAARAAYEWLVSLGEVDRHRASLGDRLHEVRLVDLAAFPEQVLSRLCTFLDAELDQRWMKKVIGMLKPDQKVETATVMLPPAMCAAFNAYQDRFGFAKRATTLLRDE